MTGVLLVATDHGQMPTHYGIDAEHNHAVWQSVTPLALPDTAARRRIDPSRIRENAKGGRERAQEEQGASRAVLDALRHASERTPVVTVVVQREPFSGKGQRAESFATDRFGKHRLWHVQLTLAGAIAGPLVLGDGRWFGLGLMAPVRRS
jgi:CRISPR-associated protein Csb2